MEFEISRVVSNGGNDISDVFLPLSWNYKGDIMSYVPMSAVGKTLINQSSQANMRQVGLGVAAAADALLDDTSNGAILTTLGVSAFVQTTLDDADAATFRATVGSAIGYTLQAKSAGFTAVDHFFYEMDSSGGAIAVTLPACSAGQSIKFKLAVAGNNVTITRAGADVIDGSATFVMSVAGEEIILDANVAGNGWLVG